MAGCSESDQAYNEINDSELIKASAEINLQNFDDFPFHDVPEWRYDVAVYQGPYSESGEYYQEQNIITPRHFVGWALAHHVSRKSPANPLTA